MVKGWSFVNKKMPAHIEGFRDFAMNNQLYVNGHRSTECTGEARGQNFI